MDGDAAPGLTLAAVQRATSAERASTVVDAAIAGTSWEVTRVRRAARRLVPPLLYRVTYDVTLAGPVANGATQERRETLVGRACFQQQDWISFKSWLQDLYGENPCRPLERRGYPIFDDDAQVAWWFFPVDPALPTLVDATDVPTMRRLLAPRYSARTRPAHIHVEPVRYVPEQSAVIRYRVTDRAAPEAVLYGKVYRESAGPPLHELMVQLWSLSEAHPHLLQVVEPVTYDSALRLHLEKAAPGTPLSADRKSPRFAAGARAAAEALAVMHESELTGPNILALEPELARLDDVVQQLSLLVPDAGRLLRDLLVRIRKRAAKLPEEQVVFTHGDMKYDQFLDSGNQFTLVDFTECGQSESSWDLGKWCAHAVPSMPETWEDSEGAERARSAFLERYGQLRPHATVQRFAVYEAVHLANRAMVLMWGQVAGWESSAMSLLALAMERLQQAP